MGAQFLSRLKQRGGVMVAAMSNLPPQSLIGSHVSAYRLQVPPGFWNRPARVSMMRFLSSNSFLALFSVSGELKPHCSFITLKGADRSPLFLPR